MNNLVSKIRLVMVSALMSLFVGCSDLGSDLQIGSAHFDGKVQTSVAKDRAASIGVMASTETELYLEYGVESGQYTSTTSVFPLSADKLNVFEVSDLEDDSQYFYRVRFRTDESEEFSMGTEYSFKTLESAVLTSRFASRGDSGFDAHNDFDQSCGASERCQSKSSSPKSHSVTTCHDSAVDAEFASFRHGCSGSFEQDAHDDRSRRRGSDNRA